MKAKQYEVIGNCKVHGHKKGERFWATYKPELEAMLLGTHIAVVLAEPVTRAAGKRQSAFARPSQELRRPPVEPKPTEAEEAHNRKEQ